MSDNAAKILDRKSKIVLGVDDAQDNLNLLKLSVETAGYTFMGAKVGLECLRLFCRMIPKLILLHIEMPGIDGFETCRRIRHLSETQLVPLAFLTRRKTPDDVNTA